MSDVRLPIGTMIYCPSCEEELYETNEEIVTGVTVLLPSLFDGVGEVPDPSGVEEIKCPFCQSELMRDGEFLAYEVLG